MRYFTPDTILEEEVFMPKSLSTGNVTASASCSLSMVRRSSSRHWKMECTFWLWSGTCRCWIRSRFTIFRTSTGPPITCRQFRFTVECIQMVIGYLDIFVFEEFVLALWPVVDGSDCVLKADSGIIVSDEIYRGQYFNFMYWAILPPCPHLHFSNKLAGTIFRKWLVNSVLQHRQCADSPIFSWELAGTGSSTKQHNHLSFSRLQPHASTLAPANLFRIFIAKKRSLHLSWVCEMERIVSKKAYICNAEVRTQNTKSR